MASIISQIHLFQVVALVFAILAFIISFVALLTPSWQVVYAREIMQWIQAGEFRVFVQSYNNKHKLTLQVKGYI